MTRWKKWTLRTVRAVYSYCLVHKSLRTEHQTERALVKSEKYRKSKWGDKDEKNAQPSLGASLTKEKHQNWFGASRTEENTRDKNSWTSQKDDTRNALWSLFMSLKKKTVYVIIYKKKKRNQANHMRFYPPGLALYSCLYLVHYYRPLFYSSLLVQ